MARPRRKPSRGTAPYRPEEELREATILIPKSWPSVRDISLPIAIPNLPGIHERNLPNVRSWRRHARAHHRMLVIPRRRDHYVRRRVRIPREARRFESFRILWVPMAGAVAITDYNDPYIANNRDMNRKRRDWKHFSRSDRDHSRVAAIRVPRMHISNDAAVGMYAALRSGDPAIAADTALYVRQVIEG